MYDAVVVGAGMSGLAAGIRMAQFDRNVCILEKHSTIGGLNSFYRRNGRNFDVGLHALTNYVPKGTKAGPLARIVRHLRMSWDEFGLTQQNGSSIAFPGVSLNFTNDFGVLEAEIAEKFPSQIDGFRRMVDGLVGYDQLGLGTAGGSAREYVSSHISDPALVDMIFCPLLYYGGAREQDMEFGQFCVMFRSIFLEGFARPFDGVRHILLKLLKKFRNLGGELRLRCGVEKIVSDGDSVDRIILDNGEEIRAKRYLSSAGWPETMKLCGLPDAAAQLPAGKLGFIETISVLDAPPKKFGHDKTIVFFNDSERFDYRNPNELVDLRSGVVCSPNNFAYTEPLEENMIRITALANYDLWRQLSPEEYRRQKLLWYERTLESAARFIPDFRRHVVDVDMFTPLTIQRYTGRERGAIYGAADKKYDGLTPFKNLFVCGADQGMVGVIGALVSGVAIANKYALAD
ncbi:MAG: NAD(P)/FAD-dependent oxidoreductase [Thermoguttaceae bacterium]|nr:NAD(P)/FAD-dependent oxidoreductase [Thermoguttaceae bacterium]MBR4103417.1 NAD(P)/FAD-dependent oxidoreductase [Thermoguttaceae bacterium]